jgi:cytochrome c oxidase assembly protein subunit 15
MKVLLNVAVLLALVVVSLGAYVRLSDAGLGCPDWPGCYGRLIGVPDAIRDSASTAVAFPDQVVVPAKAWKEMVHRYAAGTLTLLILALVVKAWRRRREQSPALPLLLLSLIIVQALLGMLTVTLLLKPVVVAAHLLGGMATLGLLLWLRLREGTTTMAVSPAIAAHSLTGLLAIALLTMQIGLGGWVSSNYAALACPDFPACRDGHWLPVDMPTAIHIAHRAGALCVAIALGALVLVLRSRRMIGTALLVAVALALQLGLGVANVLERMPLALAVAHNTGAALLLLSVLFANARLRQQKIGTGELVAI